MLTFLTFGTIWYWLLLSLAVIVGILCVEAAENGLAATITLIIATVLLGNLTSFREILHEPSRLFTALAIYFGAGIVWAFIKWYFFVKKQYYRYLEAKRTYVSTSVSNYHPQVSQHKGDITRWMTYWPLSMLGSMFNDVVRKTWTHIFYAFRNLFQKISDRVFASVLPDNKKTNAA
jgi:hypothetical protein